MGSEGPEITDRTSQAIKYVAEAIRLAEGILPINPAGVYTLDERQFATFHRGTSKLNCACLSLCSFSYICFIKTYNNTYYLLT